MLANQILHRHLHGSAKNSVKPMRDSAHYVQFFNNDLAFVQAVSAFLHEGLLSGSACMAVLTPSHREQVDARLRELGLDPTTLAAQYRYITLDAPTLLASFLNQGVLDRHRFHHDMGQLMRQVGSGGRHVCAVGEMASLLAQQAGVALAIQLEEFWNELSRHFSFSLFCGYDTAALHDDLDGQAYKRLCAVHSHVIHAD